MKIKDSWVDSTDQAKLRVYKFECPEQGFEHRPNDSTRSNLLFSHANGFHGRCFDPIIESLCGEFDCTSFDLRGHGDSVASADWSVDWQGYGDDALCVARSLRPGLIAFGHSMGGAALVMAALRAPEIFRALILFEPIIFPDDMRSVAAKSRGASPLAEGARRRRNSFASRAEAFANYASKPPMNEFDQRSLRAFVDHGFKDAVSGLTLKCAPEHEARNFEMGALHETWDNLRKLQVKTWVLSGVRQPMQPSGFASRIAEQIRGAQFQEMRELNHFGPMQKPEALAQFIRQVHEATTPNT